MADYIFEATIKLRIKDADSFIDATELAEDFFSIGLENLTYSDDEDDDHYEIEGVKIHWDRTDNRG